MLVLLEKALYGLAPRYLQDHFLQSNFTNSVYPSQENLLVILHFHGRRRYEDMKQYLEIRLVPTVIAFQKLVIPECCLTYKD